MARDTDADDTCDAPNCDEPTDGGCCSPRCADRVAEIGDANATRQRDSPARAREKRAERHFHQLTPGR